MRVLTNESVLAVALESGVGLVFAPPAVQTGIDFTVIDVFCTVVARPTVEAETFVGQRILPWREVEGVSREVAFSTGCAVLTRPCITGVFGI